MVASKHAHFAELERLNTKHDRGEPIALAEKAYLDELLADHDLKVRTFAAASRALASTDAAAHRQLLEMIAADDAEPAPPQRH